MAKPYVDPSVLLNCLEKHVDLLQDLGAYEALAVLQPVASRP